MMWVKIAWWGLSTVMGGSLTALKNLQIVERFGGCSRKVGAV